MKILLLIAFLCITCCGQTRKSPDQTQGATVNYEKVELCQLQDDPGAYNQRLIEITAFASHGFEDSSIYDPACPRPLGIWMEFGGVNRTGTMYCCGESDVRTAPESLTVEGIETSLKEDKEFKKFDELLHVGGGRNVHATLRGRFFSGTKEKFPGGEHWVGYGHFGMFSLFVIQEVVSVDPHDLAELDYASSVESPDLDKEGCGSMGYLDTDKAPRLIELQTQADRGSDTWRYDQPERVAVESLAKSANVSLGGIRLKEIKKTAYRAIYYWQPKGKRGVRYMVVVNRPYWLSFRAKERARTIWAAAQIYSICS
ncbi:MAG: hypothetical protein WBO68_06670 [Pyrinomonadaceae bacterium]